MGYIIIWWKENAMVTKRTKKLKTDSILKKDQLQEGLKKS